jgi:hypothetical protein
MEQHELKPYSTPELTVHGDIERITLQGGASNRDMPSGANNTAFPNSPP